MGASNLPSFCSIDQNVDMSLTLGQLRTAATGGIGPVRVQDLLASIIQTHQQALEAFGAKPRFHVVFQHLGSLICLGSSSGMSRIMGQNTQHRLQPGNVTTAVWLPFSLQVMASGVQ